MALGIPTGATIQLYVSDGRAGREWYECLFGRPPDLQPAGDDTHSEWQFRPGYWEIHIVEKELGAAGSQHGRLRFGVSDIAAERGNIVDLGVDVDETEQFDGLVRWCNFEDPWGNKLGLYQDLSRWPAN